MRQRLSVSVRKEEILHVAKQLFLKQGILSTTMEDVIKQTSLSKGGVYHYYANIYEMLFDLMLASHQKRIDDSMVYLKQHHLSLDNRNMAELLTQKVLTDNEIVDLYAQLLIYKRYDSRLEQLWVTLLAQSKVMLEQAFNDLSEPLFRFLTAYLNALLLAGQLDDNRAIFSQERELIKELMYTVLQHFQPEVTSSDPT